MEGRVIFGVILPVPSTHEQKRRSAMSSFKPTFIFFGAVAIWSTALATPLAAQQAMSEPAYCAFFYPNANCQNKGPGNPYTDPNYRRNSAQNNQAWSSGQTVGIAGKRPRTHRADPSATRAQ
jgi:hypothetical protein